MIEHAERWNQERNTLDFQTDGLVVKVDDLNQRERLGSRSKSPRWTIAFKYEAEQAITRLLGIHVQVGKTGKITPVAELEPVQLAGTTVKRATCTMPTSSSARTSWSATPSSSRRPARSSRRSSGSRPTHAKGPRRAFTSPRPARVAERRSNGRATRSTITAPTRRRDAPTSSRNGCAGTPIATPWISTAWARS